jgi:hypothetical protein
MPLGREVGGEREPLPFCNPFLLEVPGRKVLGKWTREKIALRAAFSTEMFRAGAKLQRKV